ncbi:hypothetical protein ACF0H5_001973 [Mactra antiquata]
MNIEWGSGYQGPPIRSQQREYERSFNDRRDPLRLHNYNGPYDRRLLLRSQDNLLTYVQRKQGSSVWQTISSKTTICGYRYNNNSDDGFGEASNMYSHAGNPSCWNSENNDSDEMPTMTTYISDDDDDDDDDNDCIVINDPETSTDVTKTISNEPDAEVSFATMIKQLENVRKTKTSEATISKRDSDFVDLTNGDYDDDVETAETDCFYFTAEDEDELVKGGDSDVAKVKNSSEELGVVSVEDDESGGEDNTKDIFNGESSSNDSSKNLGSENTNETEISNSSENTNGCKLIKKNDDMLNMFQCEYCQKVFESSIDMMTHMRHELHSSASSVLVKSDDDSVIFMQSPTKLTFKPAMYQKLVATCPESSCRSIFPDVNSCVSHTVLFHKKAVECYALTEVVNLDYYHVNESEYYACDKCDYSAKHIKKLIGHFYKKNHLPFQRYDDCSVYYLCGHCFQVLNTLVSAVRHVTKHHNEESNLTVSVLSLSNDKRVVELPPYTKDVDGERKSIKSRMKALRSAKGFKGKKRRRRYKEKMLELKQVLSSL